MRGFGTLFHCAIHAGSIFFFGGFLQIQHFHLCHVIAELNFDDIADLHILSLIHISATVIPVVDSIPTAARAMPYRPHTA